MVGPRITAMANPRMKKSFKEAMEMTVRDMKRMTTQVDRRFRENEKRLFASEGRSGGRAWKRLSPAYAKAKRKAVGSRKIMQRTGTLRRGLTQKSHPDHIARFVGTKDGRIKVGVQNIVAAYHGAAKGRQNPRLPKRNVMQMTAKQRRRYFRIVSDYLVNIKWKRGFRFLKAEAAFNAFRRKSV